MAYYTRHAQKRCAQRSIPPTAIDCALDYGVVRRVNGADSYFFNAPAKRRLRRELGRDGFRRTERYLRIYLIVSDDN
jgi:hypothetical protein